MFSFFKSKKPSPSSSPESEQNTGSGSDFVVVDPQPGNINPTQPGLYPHFNQMYPYPPTSLPGVIPAQPPPVNTSQDSPQHTNYLHGVPFKLSSELSTGDTNEIMKIQVDDILAIITSKMEVSKLDYDFGLERSIISQEATD